MLKLFKRKKYKLGFILSAIFLSANLSFCFASFNFSQTSLQSAISKKGSRHHSSNSLLPCCQNHEAGTKIDAPKKQSGDNCFLAYLNLGNSFLETFKSSNNSSYILQLDSPPPEKKLTGSVYKKE